MLPFMTPQEVSEYILETEKDPKTIELFHFHVKQYVTR